MKHWEINKTTYKVSDFLSFQRNKSLILSPSFQRRPVWKPEAKSYLIDTIVRGLPVPIIIIRDKRTILGSYEPQREVIDGQQRIRTVISYIDPKLLKDYDPLSDDFTVRAAHNKDIAGLKFDELSEEDQHTILDYQFSVHVLPAQVDDREVLQIFARINSTGVVATKQELRNAQFQGEFKTCVYDLASSQLNRWRDWHTFSEYDIARMEEVELTSELVIMMFQGIIKREPGTINSFYTNYDAKFPQRDEVQRRFEIVMDTIDAKLGQEMPKMVFKRKTVIYDLIAFFYNMQFGEKSPLEYKAAGKISKQMLDRVRRVSDELANKLAPEKVLQAAVGKTANAGSRRSVVNYLSGIADDA